jgi:hypothetical protein
MMLKALAILALALGLTIAAPVSANDPMPHCLPCPQAQ